MIYKCWLLLFLLSVLLYQFPFSGDLLKISGQLNEGPNFCLILTLESPRYCPRHLSYPKSNISLILFSLSSNNIQPIRFFSPYQILIISLLLLSWSKAPPSLTCIIDIASQLVFCFQSCTLSLTEQLNHVPYSEKILYQGACKVLNELAS